jgi:hypothetical protein
VSISLVGLDTIASPEERLRASLADVERATRNRRLALDRVRREGMAEARLSVVIRAHCAACQCSGFVLMEARTSGGANYTVGECPSCPRVCLDGRPYAVGLR